MVRPIKRNTLIHSIMYTPKDGDDLGWGEETNEPITVKNVRLEPKTSIVKTTTGEAVSSTTTLFWDTTFSTPIEWELDGKVKWNGKDFLVKGIDEYWDSNRLHHKEVRLI